MRSIPLRPGETFVIGDTSISAELADEPAYADRAQAHAPVAASNDATSPLIANPIQHQSNQQWLAAYEREERRLASGRVRHA